METGLCVKGWVHMELKQLQYFLAVAEQLNFSKAAQILYVSQPLLSQQIAELERQLRVTLFNRSRRSVQLTPAGIALAQEARVILERVSKAETFVQQAAAGVGLQWDLNIGYEEVFERTKLTQALLRFHQKYPECHGELACYNLGQIMKAQHAGKVDLSFTLLPNKMMDPELEIREVGEDVLVLAGARAYLPEVSMSSFLELAKRRPLLLMDNDYRGMSSIVALSEKLGIHTQYRFYQSIQSVLMNVEAGGGVTILPGSVVRTYASPYLCSLELAGYEEAKLTLVACWNQTNMNPAIPAFLECLGKSE